MKTTPSSNKPIILFDIDYTLFNTAHFKQTNLQEYKVYDEVLPVLQTLSQTAILGIFSEGEEEFQITKLKKTNIYNFFQKDHIHINILKKDKINFLSEKYKGHPIYIIDDKLPILQLMKSAIPQSKTIWIKRGEYALNQPPILNFSPDHETENLFSLPNIITSLNLD